MPRGAPDRGITAARAAAAEIVGPRYAKLAPDSLVLSVYGHTEAEREAATGYLRGQEQFADEWGDEGPLWHGHALWDAFMAGLDYARENGQEAAAVARRDRGNGALFASEPAPDAAATAPALLRRAPDCRDAG